MKVILFLFIFQFSANSASDIIAICDATFGEEIENTTYQEDFKQLMMGISSVHIERINSLDEGEFSSLVSKLNLLYAEAIKSYATEELNNLAVELGYNNFNDYKLLFKKISSSYEISKLEDHSLKNMSNTRVGQISVLTSDTNKSSKILNSNLIDYKFFDTCESIYEQCAETAILNFFGQTAVCTLVSGTGGLLAGALCQISNEINLYTNLYTCNNQYYNCTGQEEHEQVQEL
jgi:hypothetical protein